LAAKIGSAEEALDRKVRETEHALSTKVNETERSLSAKVAETESRLSRQTVEAEERAGVLVADAERQLAEAEHNHTQAFAFKRDVTERLTATHSALQEALKHLAPANEDSTKPKNNAKIPA
jgi:hypothetical protein